MLRMREAEKEERAKRYAAVRWVPRVAYFETEEQARDVLARMPVGRRAGLVDCETGDTRVNSKNYAAVMAAVRREKPAPERFRRVGQLGPIKPKRKKPRGPYSKQ
ncbi:MAG: hypothetical protein GY953_13750 [bacterium]|nr:hypothetical protein [bacterium]